VTVNCWLSMYMQLCCDGRKRARQAERWRQSDPSFIFPHYSGLAFVQTAQLVDLCMLDEGSLKFAYSILAATALYHMFNRELSLSVSGNTLFYFTFIYILVISSPLLKCIILVHSN
jgi:cyclin E